MNREEFKCQQCGKCCAELGSCLILTAEETQRWLKDRKKYHSNIGMRRLSEFMDEILPGAYDIWISPITHDDMNCPFLRKINGEPKYKCLIYDIRPEVCRDFPFDDSGNLRVTMSDVCPIVKELAKENK
jgi:Fe-S-cluster containining protein